jgi:hypothetical protein
LEVNVKVKIYIDDSIRFIEEALKEFKVGVENNDTIRIRNAAEKTVTEVAISLNICEYSLILGTRCWVSDRVRGLGGLGLVVVSQQYVGST